MPFDLASSLPQLLPAAVAWAEARSTEILRDGRLLAPAEVALAREVGVARPERVRVQMVDMIPMPQEPTLRRAAMYTGLLGPHVAGLTLGYGIYMVAGEECARLLSHECRHVHQYEAAGSIAAFLAQYLQQIAEVGYDRAPFEIDAWEWERDE
jgi:hypothetical protein